MNDFNPNDIGVPNGNYFGLCTDVDSAKIVLLSIPWDVTVSYNQGTSDGPESILDASLQVDLFDENVEDAWKLEVGTIPIDQKWREIGLINREIAKEVISKLEEGEKMENLSSLTEKVNAASEMLNNYVYETISEHLKNNKLVGLVGGDHSVPYGQIKALSEVYEDFGILHIDAHADLREAYEGFEYSHASIMYNVLKNIPQVSKLVQLGIRDYCEDENSIIQNDGRVVAFTDFSIKKDLFEGSNWKMICDKIINHLPDNVYLSFDIDGLSPEFCPGTGTPVPGGLSFSQIDYFLYLLKKSGKKIIGFDLCEVAPLTEWDANVGARILFKLLLLINS